MIRVVLVDDHWVIRQGLEAVLEEAIDMELVGIADSGPEGVRVVASVEPDVVLMDLSMPKGNGEPAIRKIAAGQPDAQIIVLTMFGEESRILAALEAGASGFLLKDSSPDQVLEAVRQAAAGHSPLDPRAASAVISALRTDTHSPTQEDLSTRELEVLDLVAKGLQNKQIARALSIAESTVKAHLTQIYGRIGVSDRLQATLWAQRNDIGRSGDGQE